jgi:hypothetical protein
MEEPATLVIVLNVKLFIKLDYAECHCTNSRIWSISN